MNFISLNALKFPIPKAIMAAEQPVGIATANQQDTAVTSTIAFTFIPPANAVAAAIGHMRAMVPRLERKFVIMVVTTQKTIVTYIPLGFSPRRLSTVCPISSPTPVFPSTVEMTDIPAIIHIMSPVRVVTVSFTERTPVTIKISTPTAGKILLILLPNWLPNINPIITPANTRKIIASCFLEIASVSFTSLT